MIAAVVLVFGGILLYTQVINDAPDALDESDLSSALGQPDPTDPPEPTDPPDPTDPPHPTDPTDPPDATSPAGAAGTTAPADSPTPPTTDGAADEPAGSFDGDWVPTAASEFGYRVQEVLAGLETTAVGRSNEIDGLLTIEGTTATALDVEVQVATISSDSSQRDAQFRGRIMNADEFPTATFQLTEPIDFGSIPVGDETITAAATGDLTLRGVSNPVSFDVTARTTDGRIGVLGSIPVVFADYGIDNPSFGAVRTEDEGLVEFVLVFEPA